MNLYVKEAEGDIVEAAMAAAAAGGAAGEEAARRRVREALLRVSRGTMQVESNWRDLWLDYDL